jgi:hypothetical protein
VILGEAPALLLREEELSVLEDVELPPSAWCDRRDGARLRRDRGRETRGPCVVSASGGAVEDLDRHGRKPNDGSLAAVESTVFEVEQAGCASCGALVRDAVQEVAEVVDITIDERADLATVRLSARALVDETQIDRLLREASPAGHSYRVRPGSWRAQS